MLLTVFQPCLEASFMICLGPAADFVDLLVISGGKIVLRLGNHPSTVARHYRLAAGITD